jgi:hypothetical protein
MAKLDLELAVVQCRTYGHGWSEFVRPDLPAVAGWRLTLRCDRCTSERHDVINLIGELQHRHYQYPDGYRLARADQTGMSLPEVRQLLYQRLRARKQAPRMNRTA